MTQAEREILITQAVECASDPNGPTNMEEAEVLVAMVERLIAKAAIDDATFLAASQVELNCPHCGERSPIAEIQLRQMFSGQST